MVSVFFPAFLLGLCLSCQDLFPCQWSLCYHSTILHISFIRQFVVNVCDFGCILSGVSVLVLTVAGSAWLYEGVSKSVQTGHLAWELQMVQLSTTRCSCIAILWVSLVSFATITPTVASKVFIVVSIYFIIDSVWKLLDTPLYCYVLLYILW